MTTKIAIDPKLESLAQDIKEFILNFNRLPSIEEVIEWAEFIYQYRIDKNTAITLIKQGAERAGWKEKTKN